MQVFVKMPGNTTLTLNVASNDTVIVIKSMTQQREDIRREEQRLTVSDVQLEDGHTLVDYRSQTETTLHLALRLRRGRQIFVKTLTGKANTLDIAAS